MGLLLFLFFFLVESNAGSPEPASPTFPHTCTGGIGNVDIDIKYRDMAKEIIDKVVSQFGGAQGYYDASFGKQPTQSAGERLKEAEEYIKNMNIAPEFTVSIDTSMIEDGSVGSVSDDGNNTFVVTLAMDHYSVKMHKEIAFQGLLAHEVGTHLVRKINNLQQDHTFTSSFPHPGHFNGDLEEGFASINEKVIDLSTDKFLFKRAVRYYLTTLINDCTLDEMKTHFRDLPYFLDSNEAEDACEKAHRFQRSYQRYFKGAMDILFASESNINFDRMFVAGLDLHDIRDESIEVRDLIFPPFYSDKTEYNARIAQLYQANIGGIDSEPIVRDRKF